MPIYTIEPAAVQAIFDLPFIRPDLWVQVENLTIPRRARIWMRRLVAVHEAGHTAISLALWQGHQEGVEIGTDPVLGPWGAHTVGGQININVLPPDLAIREAIKLSLVCLAGPMAQAMAEGEAFDVAEYLASDDADEPGSDAARVVEYMDRAARCLGLDAVDWAMIDDLNEAISDLFRSEKVIGLVNAISTALCKRGRIGEVGLGLLHERNLPEHEWVRLPSELANRWLENYRV